MCRRKNALAISMVVVVLSAGLIGALAWNVSAVSPVLQIRIDQRNPFFSPSTVTATVGTVIEWKNRTGEAHTIRADDCVRGMRCAFESRMLLPNATFTVKDLQPGQYAYHCGIHPFMRGILTVTAPKLPASSLDI